MKEILMSLATAGVLSVFCDAFLPKGGVKKYARLFIGITIATILITPLCKFLGGNGEIDTQAFAIESGYINIVESQYETAIETATEVSLQQKGITASVDITWQNGDISKITITSGEKLDAKRANEIGKITAEILNAPLCKIILKVS